MRFGSIKDSTHGGECCRRKRVCDQCVKSGSVDIAFQGLPCQPFSDMRSNGVPVEDHALFGTVFKDFIEYVQTMMPKALVVEEVMSFNKKRDDVSGRAYLGNFVCVLEGLNYSVRVVKLQASLWSEMVRDRCLGNGEALTRVASCDGHLARATIVVSV